jgi:radical SAM protein with 4Fe4S-binding SPASM domain
MLSKRSNLSAGAVLKNIGRFIPYPWIYTRFCELQAEKAFFNQLHPNSRLGRAGRIRQLSFRITDRCNLRCHTCGQWGDSGYLKDRDIKTLIRNEVSPERYVDVLQDLVRHKHHPLVYIWGGEPMLYPGVIDLIETASRLRLPTSIATNGTRIASVAEDLVKAPLYLLQISIDGHTARLQNQLRPAADKGDSFANIEAGLDAVIKARKTQKRRLPLIASLTTISKENAGYLTDIYDTFKDRVDLFVFYLSWTITPERANAHDQDFCRRFGFTPKMHWGWLGDWQPDDYEVLNAQLSELISRSKSWRETPVTIIPQILGAKDLKTYYTDHSACFGYSQCISIFQSVEIDSNGDMSPCRDYRDYIVGNIKEQTISELWNSKPYRNFRKSLATEGLMPVCSRCCGLMGY